MSSVANAICHPINTINNFVDWAKQELYDWLVSDIDTPKTNSPDSLQDIPNISGAKNSSGYDKVIPFTIGKHLLSPYYSGLPYRTISGADGENQTFHALFNLGYNDIVPTNFKLGNVDLASNSTHIENGTITVDGTIYQKYNIDLELQQGTNEVSLYTQKVVEEQLNIQLQHSEGVNGSGVLEVERAVARNAQKVQIEFTLQGLTAYDSSGNKNNSEASICIQYSLDGGSTWNNFGCPINATGSLLTWNKINDNASCYVLGKLLTGLEVYRISGFKNQVVRYIAERSFTWTEAQNTKDRYVMIRVFRFSQESTSSSVSDKIYLSGLRTWCYDYEKSKSANTFVAQAPLNEKIRNLTARVGLSITTDKDSMAVLNNSLKELNCIINAKGRTFNGSSWSSTTSMTSNPASMMLRVLQHPMRGKYVYNDSEIDMDSLGELYEWSNQTISNNDSTPKFCCNAVITSKKKTSNIVKTILATARAKLILDNKKYAVWIDKPRTVPVMVLNNQNILSASNSKQFSDVPDGVSYKYLDENNGYQQDTYTIYNDDVDSSSTENTIESSDIAFVTNPKQIYQAGRYSLACSKLRPESWIRKVSIDGYLLDIGSLVSIQDDTISVGIGDGAEILEVVENESGYITGIKTDGKMYIDSLDEEYGVKITTSSTSSNPYVITKKVSISKVGEQSVFDFVEPIAKTSENVPCVGNIVSFGYYERITTEALVFGKKDNGNGTFDLTLVPYQEGVYTADSGIIPDYDSKASKMPERDGGNYQLKPATVDDVNSKYSSLRSSVVNLADVIANVKVIKEIILYKRYSVAPSENGISSDSRYNFSDGSFTWDIESGANGWSVNFPASGTENIYMVTCTVSGNDYATITSDKWSDPILYIKNGNDGVNSADVYRIVTSDGIIFRYKNGTLSSDTEKFSFYKTVEKDTNSVIVFYKIYGKGQYNTTEWTLIQSGTASDVTININEWSVIRCDIFKNDTSENPLDSESVAIITDGNDSVIIDLDNETSTVPCTTDGQPRDLSKTSSTIYIFQGTVPLSLGSASERGQFEINIEYDGITVEGDELLAPDQYSDEAEKVYVDEDGKIYGVDYYTLPAITSFYSDVGSRIITVKGLTFNGKEFEIRKVQSFAKSLEGATGISKHLVYIYKRSKTNLTTSDLPTGNATYNFENNSITWDSSSASNGWSYTVPTTVDNSCLYKAHATAFSNESTDLIKASEWWLDGIDASDETTYKAKYDEYMSKLEPTCELDIDTVSIAVDGMNQTPKAQTFTVKVNVKQLDDDLDFSLDNISLPYGITYSRVGNKINFIVGSKIRLSDFAIKIKVHAQSKSYEENYTDENNAVYSDESNKIYTSYVYVSKSEVFEKTLSVVTVKGGVYRNTVSNITDLSIIQNLIIGDYITWTGSDTSSSLCLNGKFLMGGVYQWNGEQWEKCENDSYISTALSDSLSVVNADLKNNNSKAWQYLDHLTTNSIFADMILANTIKVDKLFAQNITMGKGGIIKSGNFDGTVASDGSITTYGSAGWAIDYNGKAVFNNVTVGGYATTEDLSSKVDTSYGEIGEGKTGFTVSKQGLLQASNAVIYGTVYATNGSFTGTINANSGVFGGKIKTTDNLIYQNFLRCKGVTPISFSSMLETKKGINIFGNLAFSYIEGANSRRGGIIMPLEYNFVKNQKFEIKGCVVTENVNGYGTMYFSDVSEQHCFVEFGVPGNDDLPYKIEVEYITTNINY